MNLPSPKTIGPAKALSARLRQKFSPGLRFRRADGLATLAPGAASDWILARGLCAFTTIDAGAVPAARRRMFALGAARRWAPFADPVFHVVWAGEIAMVWGWSASEVLAPVAAGERAPRRVLPESLFVGTPQDAGCELLRLDHGFEARAWEARVLRASTWWPTAPHVADWNVFLRGAGHAAMPAPPEPVHFPLQDSPWSARADARMPMDLTRHRALAVPALGAALLAVACFPLGSALRLLVDSAGLERAIATQEGLVAEILDARERAEADSAAIDALMELRPRVGQVRALAALLQALPGGGWQVLEWRLPEPERLEAVLRSATPDPRGMVRALEASDAFDTVSVEMGARPDEVVIKASLAGPAGTTAP